MNGAEYAVLSMVSASATAIKSIGLWAYFLLNHFSQLVYCLTIFSIEIDLRARHSVFHLYNGLFRIKFISFGSAPVRSFPAN